MTVVVALLGMTGLACSIGAAPSTPTPQASPTSAQKPTVTIQAPQDGADAVVGTPITVQATGSHPDGVTRLELRANTQQADTKVSQNPEGDQQFSAYLNFTPAVSGILILQVIAYRGDQASDPVAITLNVKSQSQQITATVAQPAGVTQVVFNDPTCRARVEVNGLNFRQGPGQNYPPFAVLSLGTIITVTGRTADLTWWQGQSGNTLGWMSASYITLLGSLCSSIPMVQIPASPVPSATITLTPLPTAAQATSATSTAILPDLVITSLQGPVSMILDPDNTKTATYVVTVQNVGNAITGAFHVGIVLPDGTLRDMGSVTGLVPSQQAIFSTDILFTAPGSARLTAVADTGAAIVETDETNNLKSLDVVLIKPTGTAVSATATNTLTRTPTSTPTSTAAQSATPTATPTSTATATP